MSLLSSMCELSLSHDQGAVQSSYCQIQVASLAVNIFGQRFREGLR
jgi:hypothetical protein